MPIHFTPQAGYAPNLHGPGSLFGGLTADAVANATPSPVQKTILDFLPVTDGNNRDAKELPLITGYAPAAVGADQTTACEPASHTIGDFKLCVERINFGRLSIRDKSIDLDSQPPLGPNENANIKFIGDPLSGGSLVSPDEIYPGVGGATLSSKWALMARAFMFGLYQQVLPTVWTGTGADGTDKSWNPPKGLDALIYTGHVDADTAVACAGADSIVNDFASVCICDDATPNAPRDIANMIINTELSMHNRAKSHFPGRQVTWIRAMHTDLFRALTKIWPYAITQTPCNVPSGSSSVVFNISDPVQMADKFFNEGYLPIPGAGDVKFLLDDSIPFTESVDPQTGYVSNIYWIPYTVGGEFMTWVDYARYDEFPAYVQDEANLRTLQNGRWLTYRNGYSNGCGGETTLTFRPRYLMRTPQLAAKITNVCYDPGYDVIDWTDSDGGGSAVRS